MLRSMDIPPKSQDDLQPLALIIIIAILLLVFLIPAHSQDTQGARGKCTPDNGGITLSPGFCATVFADKIGHARHMAVGPDGTVYVNTWSGRYYGYDKVPPGGFLVALQDTKGSGHADKVERFGGTLKSGSAGGTGIALYNGALYAEVNDRIERYSLHPGSAVPTGPPEVIVSGLPLSGDHPMHPFQIDAQGKLYVDLGSATNSCQKRNRMLNSPGIDPCTELETRGGTWVYDANKTGQHFSPAERFVTGLRNGEGFAFDKAGRLFATMHGRDQLGQNWPKLFSIEQSAHEPAEELVQLEKGADFGWPYCYFDNALNTLVLAPEYGGDGKKVGLCAEKQEPVAAFPAHWAPNDLTIYNANQFPATYRGGAFIAFHGSWNRAPLPQGGYNVVFQPLADGKPSGKFVVFADGFAGAIKEPGRAAHRPSGLAIGPDGALYISDDQHGRIWRVTYTGEQIAGVQPALPPSAALSSYPPGPPEGTNPEAGHQSVAALPPRLAYHRIRSSLGAAFFWARQPAALVRAATAPTPKARRSRLPSSPSIGFGVMEACNRLSRQLRTACRNPGNTVTQCPRWEAQS
jgi:glucose/arabinose dehydrogenase